MELSYLKKVTIVVSVAVICTVALILWHSLKDKNKNNVTGLITPGPTRFLCTDGGSKRYIDADTTNVSYSVVKGTSRSTNYSIGVIDQESLAFSPQDKGLSNAELFDLQTCKNSNGKTFAEMYKIP